MPPLPLQTYIARKHPNALDCIFKPVHVHSLMTLYSSGFLSAFCQHSTFTATAMLIRYKGYNNISLLPNREGSNTIITKQLRVIRTKTLTELV